MPGIMNKVCSENSFLPVWRSDFFTVETVQKATSMNSCKMLSGQKPIQFTLLHRTATPSQQWLWLKTSQGGTWVNFCWVCAAGLSAPLPHYSLLWPIIDPILVTFGQICNFRNPNLVTFYFYELTHFFKWNEEHFIFHLQYKHSGTFANHKYEELSYPKKFKNVRPHPSNSIENATPLQSIQWWKCNPIRQHIPISLL